MAQRYLMLAARLLVLFYCVGASAQSWLAPRDFRVGAVMARAIILDKSGQPILVQYNEDGTEDGLASIESGYKDKIKTLRVIAAAEYHAEKDRLELYKEQHASALASGAEVKSKKDFLSEQYTLADGETVIAPPGLPDYVKSVLVRAQHNRVLNDPQQLVLLRFSVDLSEEKNPPETGSVVLSEEGIVVGFSEKTIGPRVGFFGDPEKNDNSPANQRKHEDKIFGPVPNVKVHIPIFKPAVNVTDKDGKYSLRYNLPSCPGFSYLYQISVVAELKYFNFSPLGEEVETYPIMQPTYISCNGSHAFLAFSGNLVGIGVYLNQEAKSSSHFSDKQVDLFADVMFLAGKVLVKNPGGGTVAIGDQTEYAVSSPEDKKVNQTNYDFDGDGKSDTTTIGNVQEQVQEDGSIKKVFTANANGNWQAVYFSSNTAPSGEPDAIRLADNAKKLESNGLLASISKEDLKNTDILVFRESTGELYMERKGLPDEEIKWEGASDEDEGGQIGLGEGGQYFHYRLAIRGIMDMDIDFSGDKPTGTWNDWATAYHLEEPFEEHQAYHLHPGEWIRVVAINRATGYMGTKRVLLNSASDNGSEKERVWGMMSRPVEDIVMMPPNLTIWATRDYTESSGLGNGTEKKFNLIGAEGAGLVSDQTISVFTEWLDEEGRPLPDGLGSTEGKKYGLTGRLARVVGGNQLSEVGGGGDAAGFPIAPGMNRQILNIHDNLTQAEHLYIHVSGTAQNESPQFTTGNTTEALSGRPKHVTPFMVPVYDEGRDWEQYSAWRLAKEAFEAASGAKPLKQKAAYQWLYRPEYQFSQYQLEVDNIKRHFKDSEGNDKEVDILNGSPALLPSDKYLEVFYSLIDSVSDRLNPVDGPQDLVLAIGANEVKLTVESDQSVRFYDLNQLGALLAEDFLSLRLYINGDAGNILWQYAFGTGLRVITSGDEGSREAKSFLLRSTEDPIKVEWLPALEQGDQVQWKVEALIGNPDTDDLGSLTNADNKKYMYGKVQLQTLQDGTTLTGTGTGRYETAWTSTVQVVGADLTKYKQVQFKPDMTGEPHPAWGSGGSYKGTNKKDAWRRNPLVGYKVTFILNGEEKVSAKMKMDEIDGLRQEYLDLLSKTSASGTNVNGIDFPPERSVFKLLADMPTPINVWVDLAGDDAYPYTVILDDGMSSIYNQLTTAFQTFRQTAYQGVSVDTIQQVVNGQVVEVEQPIMVSVPTEISLNVSSGYRNPERQERQGGTSPASRSAHMSGKALDVTVIGATGTENERLKKNAKAYYGLWLIVRNGNVPDANWYQLEYGSASKIVQAQEGGTLNFGAGYDFILDSDRDGVPNSVEETHHFHLDARDI